MFPLRDFQQSHLHAVPSPLVHWKTRAHSQLLGKAFPAVNYGKMLIPEFKVDNKVLCLIKILFYQKIS